MFLLSIFFIVSCGFFTERSASPLPSFVPPNISEIAKAHLQEMGKERGWNVSLFSEPKITVLEDPPLYIVAWTYENQCGFAEVMMRFDPDGNNNIMFHGDLVLLLPADEKQKQSGNPEAGGSARWSYDGPNPVTLRGKLLLTEKPGRPY
ncbi:MAG: hypothetical protein AB1405_05025, partial [Bdellovibrionota bacterium]